MSATGKRKKSGSQSSERKKKGFDAKYALPSREEQQVLRQIGLDTQRSSAPRRGAGSTNAQALKNSMMVQDDGAAAPALKSGLEVAHNNNLWNLQTKDLLKDAAFDYAKVQPLTDALYTIKQAIDGVEGQTVTRNTADSRFLSAFLRDFKPSPVVLDFAPPSAVDIVGSFLIRTQLAGSATNVDMAVQIPDECLDAKDYLNNRYFEKRALYLAVIAAHLDKTVGDKFSVGISYFRDDERKSMIVLRAKTAADEPAQLQDGTNTKGKKRKNKSKRKSSRLAVPEIRILATTSPTCGTLTLKRLRPGRTNVRVHGHTYGEPGTGTEALATPNYSAAVAEDLAMKTHLQYLHAAAQKFPGFTGAVVLLKVWLARRRYHCTGSVATGKAGSAADDSREIQVTDTDCAAVTGFHLSMILLHLVWQNKIQTHMQPLQMFKVVLQFLGQQTNERPTVLETGIVMCPRDKLGS